MPLGSKIAAFIAASAGIAAVSWSSLRDVRTHGFYRFFAWEAILALILLNFDCWFCEPFSVHQAISWPLLIASLLPAILGARSLRRVGRPSDKRVDRHLIGVEKTTNLITVGVYRYIRHPIYASLLLLAWGVFFKQPSIAGVFLTVLAALFQTVTAKVEETESLRYFGAAYQDYMNRTKMFIPFLF
jgi:protein-S-isoprenylcysteine O-methyltransferase Ste14